MTAYQKISIVLLRVSIGWYFFWAGITKVFDPAWSAIRFLQNATMFKDFYAIFAHPALLPTVNILNSWGLTLIGVALMLGVSVRISATCGALLMLLYYFPHEGVHSFIVDDHIVFICALAVLAHMDSGRVCGLSGWCANLPFIKDSVFLQRFIS